MRKFGLVLLVLLFFFSLLGLAFSTSSNIAFTHPHKMESWLNDSNLYGAFVANAIDQAEKTAGNDQSGGVSLSDTAVKQAAQSTFTSKQLGKNVNTFIESNYSWLEGKASKPSFSIDLSAAKQSFAEQVGQYVKTYLTGLPACTPAQTAAIDPQTADPLSLSCRPAGLDPATSGSQVTEQIANNGNFLSDPVITASTINPDGTTASTPYYQKLSFLPKAYRAGLLVPWVAGALAILSGIGVFFSASRKRKGVKIIGSVLAIVGVILVCTKFTSDQAFNKVEHHIFNEKTVGQLQKALTVFFNHVEDQLVKVDLWFGIGYLVLALVILIALISTRQRRLRPIVANGGPPVPSVPSTAPARSKSPKPITGPKKPPARKTSKPSSYPKRPRLVQ